MLSSNFTGVKLSETSPSASENFNRELLKRVGKLTGYSSKEIAATLSANFPGFKSNQLGEDEVKAMVDALCIDAAARNGMNPIEVWATFNDWLQQQPQGLGNEELAQLWMDQIKTPAF